MYLNLSRPSYESAFLTKSFSCAVRGCLANMLEDTKMKKISFKSMPSSGESFSETTSLHGIRHLNKRGEKFLWLAVLIGSIVGTLFIFKDALEDYFGDNMKITLNSPNTPYEASDFPVITICNNNLVSRNRMKINPNQTITTYQDAKEFSQPCKHLILVCLFGGVLCTPKSILTDKGWCCQVDPRLSPTDELISDTFFYFGLDAQTYDYSYPSWFAEGLSMSVDAYDSYPDFTGKSSFITPGTNTMIRLTLQETYTTKAALQRPPDKRQCYSSDEVSLKHFDVYTQQNCLMENYIEAVLQECNCVGKHTGFKVNENLNDTLECTILGGMGWLDKQDYQQCQDRGTSYTEVLLSAHREAHCLVNCNEYRYSLELSVASSPGYMALCVGNEQDYGTTFYHQVACLFSIFGLPLGSQVCDTLHLYDPADPEDVIHVMKRKSYCTDLVKQVWTECKSSVQLNLDSLAPNVNLVQCLEANLDISQLIELKAALDNYARDNIALLQISVKGQYYTSIERDVSYTFSSLVANIGGLLGLSMGCSIISIAEIFILPLRNLSRRKKN